MGGDGDCGAYGGSDNEWGRVDNAGSSKTVIGTNVLVGSVVFGIVAGGVGVFVCAIYEGAWMTICTS